VLVPPSALSTVGQSDLFWREYLHWSLQIERIATADFGDVLDELQLSACVLPSEPSSSGSTRPSEQEREHDCDEEND
jgi:hypothetical protein